MPLVGKTAQVGLERSLGAILGGTLGFATYTLGAWARPHWSEWEDGVFLSVIASVVAAVSVLVGKRLGLDLSARLFVMTFLLTTFGAAEGQGALPPAPAPAPPLPLPQPQPPCRRPIAQEVASNAPLAGGVH